MLGSGVYRRLEELKVDELLYSFLLALGWRNQAEIVETRHVDIWRSGSTGLDRSRQAVNGARHRRRHLHPLGQPGQAPRLPWPWLRLAISNTVRDTGWPYDRLWEQLYATA
jgi:hypothetical protein